MTDIVERLRYTANIRAIHRSDDDPIKLDCIEAAAEIERLRAALEWYGNPENWTAAWDHQFKMMVGEAAYGDKGERARAALADGVSDG